MASTTNYIVHVQTGDRFGAGTDANVYLRIQGDAGELDAVQLKNERGAMFDLKNQFERNRRDTFILQNVQSVGTIKSIDVWHDNSGIGPAWFLEYVEISDPDLRLTFRFPCHKWLRKPKDDEQDESTKVTLRCMESFKGPGCVTQPAMGVLKFTNAAVNEAMSEKAKQVSLSVSSDRCEEDGKIFIRFNVRRTGQP
jgi:hypothetical protein